MPHLLDKEFPFGDVTIPVLALLCRAAPERHQELKTAFDDYKIKVLKTDNGGFSLNAIYSAIQIGSQTTKIMWLLTHSAWESMKDYGTILVAAQARHNRLSEEVIEKAFAEFGSDDRGTQAAHAALQLANGEEPEWPQWIPPVSPNMDDLEQRAISELWALAVSWALFHELKHAELSARDFRPNSALSEEEIGDKSALDKLFERVKDYVQESCESEDKVIGKRAMGALVGLFAVSILSPNVEGSETHPSLGERVSYLFDKVGTRDAGKFWDFASGIIFAMHPNKGQVQVEPRCSMRETLLELLKTY